MEFKQAAFTDFETELKLTRRVLERVPDEHFGWKPHEKSWSLGELATHIVNLLLWQTAMLQQDEYDFATSPPPSGAFENRDVLLQRWDENVAALRQAWEETAEDALHQTWTLRFGPRVLSASPRHAVVRRMGLSHLVHHRGQLTVYLRLLDVPLPGLYGPTADEQPGR